MEQNEQKKDTRIEAEFDGAIEIKPFDISPYVGMKGTIENVETHYNNKLDSYYLLVKTATVAYLDDEKTKPVCASRIYSLLSQDGKFGWRKGGALDLFLIEHQASKPDELKGKEVLMFPSKPNKEGIKFLTF